MKEDLPVLVESRECHGYSSCLSLGLSCCVDDSSQVFVLTHNSNMVLSMFPNSRNVAGVGFTVVFSFEGSRMFPSESKDNFRLARTQVRCESMAVTKVQD